MAFIVSYFKFGFKNNLKIIKFNLNLITSKKRQLITQYINFKTILTYFNKQILSLSHMKVVLFVTKMITLAS